MTATAVPLRTLAETREPRTLPSPTDPAWSDPTTVWRIATYVDRPAHSQAHPRAVHGCPWCPSVEGEPPNRSSETYWREVADRPAFGAAA